MRVRARATAGDRQSEGNLLAVLGGLYAMQGAFDRARDHVTRARSLFEELGLDMDAARVGMEAGRTERLAGELDAAEAELRRSYAALEAVGEKYILSTIAGFLARTILDRGGSLADAQQTYCDRSRELASDGDIATQALWRCARGRTSRPARELADGEALVRRGARRAGADGFHRAAGLGRTSTR